MAQSDYPIDTRGVVGIDGTVPVYQPDARWCWWNLNEIYIGTVGKNRYVPKLNDYVIDHETYTVYIVKHIDPVTLIARLEEIRPANMSFSLTETDVLFGVGPGTQSDTYRVYLDQSVTPHILAVDARLKIAGSMSSYAKLFKGADLSDSGHVISRLYDASGNILSDKIPLELVALNNQINYAIRAVSVCYTNENLIDGEIVTAVVYTDEGHVVSKRQLLVENTGFIRGINVGERYVSHISLESPFLAPTIDTLIEFPLNIPTNALNLIGVVHYSDGSVLKLPVDGSKFAMHGLDQFVSTIVGQRIELVLAYTLSPGETAYGVMAIDNHTITEPYSLMVINPNNSLAVKLFGYPVWVSDTIGYQMHWYLYNLDRNIVYDATPHVRYAESTGAFDPKGYGYLQRKQIILNLRDVSGSFKPVIHTQIVDITLNSPPNSRLPPWSIALESATNRPGYIAGIAIYESLDHKKYKLDYQNRTYQEWLDHLYYDTYPLVDRYTTLMPPVPTHFEIHYQNTITTYQVSEWNQVLECQVELMLHDTLWIRFIRQNGMNELQLSTVALVISN